VNKPLEESNQCTGIRKLTKIKPSTSPSFWGGKRENAKQLDFALSQDKTLLQIYFDQQLLAAQLFV